MKKVGIIILGGMIFILGLVSVSSITEAREIPWAQGMRSDEVKVLQEILKEDPDVYPEGYVTGFFGPLTEKAVKKLQKKCGLPETGIYDEETEKCIFPILEIKVTSPNGAEVWDRNQIQTIKWQIIAPTGQEIKQEDYFKPKASIDLFRKVAITMPCSEGETCESVERSVFVRHIATVNLFNGYYSWEITDDIKNGKDYIIRISVGRNIIPIILEKTDSEEIWPVSPRPTWINWDESDGPFEITGEIQPPELLPLGEVIKILENIMTELQKAIALLKEMAY